jgi:tetratricopeptide (TPR) repeat protein
LVHGPWAPRHSRRSMTGARQSSPCRLVIAVLALAAACFPSMASAEDDIAAARAHYETGVRHFDLSEYEPALVEFKEAYRNKPDPVFLYNIAQCHRKLGHTDEAITFYQNYLRRAPEAKNHEEVERRIAELQSLRGDEHAPLGSSTDRGLRPSSATSSIDLSQREESAAKPHGAITTRWWFWTAIGAVAVGTAVTVGILATRDPTRIPTSSLGAQKVLP